MFAARDAVAVEGLAGETRSDTATVVGVVIAGVLASVVIPGPYDWGSSMIGALLLTVLVAYAHVPSSAREAAGLAAATGFALLLLLGRLLDGPLDLSGLPEANTSFAEPEDEAQKTNPKPSPGAAAEAPDTAAGSAESEGARPAPQTYRS